MWVSSFFSAIRRSSPLSKIRATIFTGWEVREKILRPVIVNLLTALLIFLVAVLFKDPIYNYFAPQPVTKDWPIFCVVEPEPNHDGDIKADVFVLNLTPKKYLAGDLDSLAKEQSPPTGKKLSPLIEIDMKDNQEGAISDIQADDEFNKEKGSVTPIKLDPSHWQVRLDEIKDGKILKFVIHTTTKRTVSSRSSFETLPIKVSYARSR